MDSVFDGLNVTNQFCDHWCTVLRSAFSCVADSDGSSTMMYKLVSSANSSNFRVDSLNIS